MRKIISFAAMLLIVCAIQSQTLFLKDSVHVTLDEVTVSTLRATKNRLFLILNLVLMTCKIRQEHKTFLFFYL